MSRQIPSELPDPHELGKLYGIPAPKLTPNHFLPGPIHFGGTFDYDAAADTVLSLKLAASQIDLGWANVFGNSNDNPKVRVVVAGVKVLLLDDAIYSAADPEKIAKVFDGWGFKQTVGNRTIVRPIPYDSVGLAVTPQEALDSDLATTTVYWKKEASYHVFPETFELDLYRDSVAGLVYSAAAASSLLGADSTVRISLLGYAYDSERFQNKGPTADLCGCTAQEIHDAFKQKDRLRVLSRAM